MTTQRPPFHNPHDYALEQERVRQDDALLWMGEMTGFALYWNIGDFERGLVERCPTCYLSNGEISEAYGQSSDSQCNACFGTTFEGGLRGFYYRPSIWNISPVGDDPQRRGQVDRQRGELQIVSDMDLRDGDLAIRCDNTRWRLDQPKWQEMTTGFKSTSAPNERIRSMVQINLQDPTMVDYQVPVDLSALDISGWQPTLNHLPHPLDQPVIG